MKKKLEAELISIAHRILKLKNRAELDQLKEETLKLYEKLSVLAFVEDNFSDVKPTIGYASAEGKLEEIYSSPLTPEGETEQETPELKANEEEAKEDSTREEMKEAPIAAKEETEVAETETQEAEPEKEEETTEEPKAEEKTEEPAPEVEAEPKQEEAEAPVAAEEEAAHEIAAPQTPKGGVTQEKQEEPVKEVEPAVIVVDAEVGLHPEEEVAITPEPELPATGTLPENEGQDKDNGAGEGVEKPGGKPAVSEEEKKNTEASGAFNFTFERKQEAPKQKEISFEDFQDYKEPEFVKKSAPETPAEPKTSLDDWRNWQPKTEEPKSDPLSDWRNWEPKKEEPKQPETPKTEPVDDWRNWQPNNATASETPKDELKPVDNWMNWEPTKSAPEEAPKDEPKPASDWKDREPAKTEAPKPATATTTEPSKPVATGIVRAMSLGLNDRIAFEKNLFGGSSEDLNRVVSQLNTLNTFQEVKDFIDDLVKPDYNNWNGKEEFEERFMQLVEKKFS